MVSWQNACFMVTCLSTQSTRSDITFNLKIGPSLQTKILMTYNRVPFCTVTVL